MAVSKSQSPYGLLLNGFAMCFLSSDFLTSLSDPQKFSVVPRDQTVTEGRDVEFLCSANGQPAPVITWTKDGKTLTFPALVILTFPEEHGPEQSLHFWGGPIK